MKGITINMDQYISILKTMPLFHGISGDGFNHVLSCLEAFEVSAKKGEILHDSSSHEEYGIILISGNLHSVLLNCNGSEHIVSEYTSGDLIGGAYACVPTETTPVQIRAVQESLLLYVRLSNLLKDSSIGCPYASQVTTNLLRHVAQSNLRQIRKINILTQKKIRDKLTMYLQSLMLDTDPINIPFNRQELADYLGVERSALSREMSLMQKNGLLIYNKNTLKLLLT